MAALDLSRFSVKQLLEIDGCTRCGECITWCPTFSEKPEREAITPLHKIETLQRLIRQQYGLRARIFGAPAIDDALLIEHAGGTYDCTLCGRCGWVCPVHIDTRSLWVAMREQLVDLERNPEAMNTLLDTVSDSFNISGDANAERLIWSENLSTVPEGVTGKQQAEVVYFVGCVASFYPQSYSIPQSFVEVLEKASVDFLTMGEAEHCCGFPLIVAGMSDSAQQLARHNVEAVRRTGARKLVASCPSCYHTWHSDYPRIIGEPLGFEVVHSTELLRDLIDEKRISLSSFAQPVTYHDPCDLGRTSGIYDAPRQVITAIPGIEFTEMKDTREFSLCCGGGGDVEMADKELSGSVARSRLKQAQATGAKVILSACQQCTRTLAGAARREKVRMRSMDVVELVGRVME
jgi:Fe-S oxidoreductase